jgi:phage head maturation protease
LGVQENNSLVIWDDGEGLKFEAILPETALARDVFELVRQRYITHLSPQIHELKWANTQDETGRDFKILIEGRLLELSLTSKPNFLRSSVETIGIESSFPVPEVPNWADEEPTLRSSSAELITQKRGQSS